MLSGHRFRLTSISAPKPESKSRKHSEGSESFSLRLFSLLTGACNSTPLRLKPEKKATLKTRAKKKFFETRQGRLTTLFSAYASSICVSSVSSQSCSIVELHSAAKWLSLQLLQVASDSFVRRRLEGKFGLFLCLTFLVNFPKLFLRAKRGEKGFGPFWKCQTIVERALHKIPWFH